MKSSQFQFFLVVLIIVFGALGYWSYRSIDYRLDRSDIVALTPEVTVVDPLAPYEPLSDQSDVGTAPVAIASASSVGATLSSSASAGTSGTLASKHSGLVKRLQALSKDAISMKVGSKGTRVGTVQEFLNVFEGVKKNIDNQYGEGLKARVLAFQKAVGDTADGLADPATYQKMVDWLNAH